MARFKPGRSGNPNGRPPGAKSTATLIRAEMVSDEDVKLIVAKVVEKAKQGDLVAASMILDRTIAKIRPRVESITDEENLAEALQAARLRAASRSGFRVSVIEDLVAASYEDVSSLPVLQVRTGVTGGLVGGDEQAAMNAHKPAQASPNATAAQPEPAQPAPAAFRMPMDDDSSAGTYASGDHYNPIGE